MSVYGPLADWYDSLTEDVDYEGLYDYLTAILRQNGVKPKVVLDMACGTGSLALMFAEKGCKTYAVDLSEEMLTRAADKASSHKKKPTFICANMADFSLPEQVDAAFCMLDSFNYLADPKDGEKALRCFYDAVRPGGIFIFDVRTPKCLRDFDGQMFMDETEDVVCIWRTEFDEEENQCFYGMDIFVREGNLWRREQEEHLEYAYEPSWLQRKLEETGFQNIMIYGERSFFPPTEEEERVFIVARKGE